MQLSPSIGATMLGSDPHICSDPSGLAQGSAGSPHTSVAYFLFFAFSPFQCKNYIL